MMLEVIVTVMLTAAFILCVTFTTEQEKALEVCLFNLYFLSYFFLKFPLLSGNLYLNRLPYKKKGTKGNLQP
jgi:hypothetical protein